MRELVEDAVSTLMGALGEPATDNIYREVTFRSKRTGAYSALDGQINSSDTLYTLRAIVTNIVARKRQEATAPVRRLIIERADVPVGVEIRVKDEFVFEGKTWPVASVETDPFATVWMVDLLR